MATGDAELESQQFTGATETGSHEASVDSSVSLDSVDSNSDTVLSNMLRFDGDTTDTTTSCLSALNVTRLVAYDVPQVEGCLLVIPIRELDDPPDGLSEDAASLGARENERSMY